jgi:8-oxo-dGTP diphosphatase
MTIVVAGILERDGRILICQRKADQAHPLKWEFPGGKVEPGEEPVAALRRELDEELGIQAGEVREVTRYEFAYPEKKPILLIFLVAAEWAGQPENRIFRQMVWVEKSRLRDYDFLEGDVPFLDKEWV